MSSCNHEIMSDNNARGVLGQIAGLLQTWQRRIATRREFGHWVERDLHDAGISWSEMIAEADKPFWRP